MGTWCKSIVALGLLGSFSAVAAVQGKPVEVLSDLSLLSALKIPVLTKNDFLGVGYAILNSDQQEQLLLLSHRQHRCAGFEALPPAPRTEVGRAHDLQDLAVHAERDRRWSSHASINRLALPKRPEIVKALSEMKEDGLREFVNWASSFPTRDNRAQDPNVAVRALADRLKGLSLVGRREGIPVQVELISHQSTRQQSVRVRIPGRVRPQEVVVLGAHFDSINMGWGGSNRTAPGADDNASGSAAIFEALKVMIMQAPPERTLDFYWYAGEESGLLGSAEIAREAKNAKLQVIGVLQLDMTLFPGNGELIIGNVSDYTSSWLRDLLVGINDAYLGVRLVDDKCGYACSDHASWYRQGYPTLMPFEATLRTMNPNIHTSNDVVSPKSSFRHALVFAKVAVAYAMELANSNEHQPY